MEDMSNAEIRQACLAAGINCGAVTATTRRLYLRKLSNIPAASTTPVSIAPQNEAASAPSRIPRKSMSTRSKGTRDPSPVIHDPPEVEERITERKSMIPKSSFKVRYENNDTDLEKMGDDQLGNFMKKIGIRHASIDSRNRPNYYKRIQNKLEETSERSTEFSTDDDDIPSQSQKKHPEQEKQDIPERVFRPPKQKQVIIQDQFSSSDEDEEENTAEEAESVIGTKDIGCSILYEYEDSEASVIDSPPKKDRNVLAQLGTNHESPSRKIKKINNFGQQNRLDSPRTIPVSPLVTKSTTESATPPLMPIITKERLSPFRENREKRIRNDIVTQAQPGDSKPATSAAYSNSIEPSTKRVKSGPSIDSDNQTDLVDLQYANLLPKFGLFALLSIVLCYVFKSWDPSSLLPTIDDEPVENPPVPIIKDEMMPVNSRQQLISIFYQINSHVINDQCTFSRIFSKTDNAMLKYSSLDLGNVESSEILDLLNSKPDIFTFFGSDASPSKTITENGYISLHKNRLEVSFGCQSLIFVAENLQIISTIVIATIIMILAGLKMNQIFEGRQKRNQLITRMTKETVDALQNHAARMGSEIGIRKEKVRDQVVMMGDDPSYWIEVEKVIKKDSRLISNQVIENGEENEIWKWQESTIAGDQGKAFDAPGPTGKDIPAECLKIRNMFEPNDSDAQLDTLKGVIAEWCKGNNGIIHVDMSRKEGFLFIKCKDRPSAGKAFEAINANWYKRKMVSVSYIRTSRYETRFPHSKGKTIVIA